MSSIYEKRPWLKNYPDHVPHDLDLTNETALGDFKKSAALNSGAPAIYYFDHEISFKQVDRFSDQLAAAFEDLGLQKGDRIILDLQNVPQFPIAAYKYPRKVGFVDEILKTLTGKFLRRELREKGTS